MGVLIDLMKPVCVSQYVKNNKLMSFGLLKHLACTLNEHFLEKLITTMVQQCSSFLYGMVSQKEKCLRHVNT